MRPRSIASVACALASAGCLGDDSNATATDAGSIDATTSIDAADAADFDTIYPANVDAASARPIATEPDFARLITSPRIVTVTFAQTDASLRSWVESFDDAITQSAWWSAVTSEYCDPDGGACIGPGASGGHVVLNEAPLAHYAEGTGTGPGSIWGFFDDRIASGALPAPTFDTIYVLLVPQGTTIDLFGRSSCTDFHSYHLGAPLGGADAGLVQSDGGLSSFFHYAIVPDCGRGTDVTAAISHELIEAATNPGGSAPGFRLSDPIWDLVDTSAEEVADECDGLTVKQDAFTVTRSWSNASVLAGHFPCVPLQGETETSVVPSQEQIDLAVGESATIDVTGFADVPAPAWTLSVEDWWSRGDAGAPYVSGAFDDPVIHAGKTVRATITLLHEPPVPPGYADGWAPFLIVSNGIAGRRVAIAAVRQKP